MKTSPQAEFWRYLQGAGVIPETTADSFTQDVRDQWMPIGRILLREKALSVPEMHRILALQAEEPGMRVGDLAVREGFCTEEDVQNAIDFQKEQCGEHPLARLIREVDDIDPDTLLQALYGYVRHLEGRVQILSDLASVGALDD